MHASMSRFDLSMEPQLYSELCLCKASRGHHRLLFHQIIIRQVIRGVERTDQCQLSIQACGRGLFRR